MIHKEYTSTGRSCRVTFTIPANDEIGQASVLGEFNDWDAEKGRMPRKKDSGNYELTVSLKPGNCYRFRYLIDEENWGNDPDADDQVVNEFGTQDSVVTV